MKLAERQATSTKARLTPDQTLVFEASSTDWRAAWFRLAADKRVHDDPVLNYWKELSSRFLTRLCHIPPQTDEFQVEPLTPAGTIFPTGPENRSNNREVYRPFSNITPPNGTRLAESAFI